jgi:putative PEP-CTERM system TPR-repeat lipoprotein
MAYVCERAKIMRGVQGYSFRLLLDRYFKRVVVALLALVLVACGEAKLTDVELVQRAKQYQAAGDMKASMIELKNALQQNPKNAEARLLLGELYLLIGNGASAEKELAWAQKLGVSGDQVRYLLGRALIQQHLYQDVLTKFENVDVTSRPNILVLRGDAYLGLGKNKEARSSYQQALVLDPGNASALMGLAKISIAVNDYKAAVNIINKVVRQSPKLGDAWILKGKLENIEADYSQAQSSFHKAIALEANNLVTLVGLEARAGLAKALISQQKFTEAEKHVAYLLDVAPLHPISNYLAALLAYDQKQYIKARDHLQTLLKTYPNYMPGIFLLGGINYALGNYEQAEQQLTQIVLDKPDLLAARLLLARVHLHQAQAERALDVLEPALEKMPNDARLLSLAGQAALQEGNIERGKHYLKNAVANAPQEAGLRAQLAMMYLAEDNDEQAIKELETAVAAGNAPKREHVLLILSYLRKKDYDKAIANTKKLLDEDGQSAYLLNLLGVIYAAKGDNSRSREAYEASLAIDADYTPAILNIAKLDMKEGRLDVARERLERILVKHEHNVSAMMALARLADISKDKEQAVKWLERAREAQSSAVAPRLILARYYLQSRKYDMARDVVDEIIAVQPNNLSALITRGKIGLETRDYNAAVSTFKQIIKLKPVAVAYYWLGIAQFRANDQTASRASLEKAIQLDPANLKAASLLVTLDMKAGKSSDAMGRVNDIQKHYPQSPVGFELAGDIFTLSKADAKAINAYELAQAKGGGSRVLLKQVLVIRRSQGNAVADNKLKSWLVTHGKDSAVRYALASAYNIEGKRVLAIQEYRHLVEVAPESVVALNDLAWLLSEEEDGLAEAERLITKAYNLQPESGPVLDTLGWILLQRGDIKSALTFLQQASRKLPNNQEAQYHLAVALAKSGKQEEAKTILRRIAESGRDFVGKEDAKRLLDSL